MEITIVLVSMALMPVMWFLGFFAEKDILVRRKRIGLLIFGLIVYLHFPAWNLSDSAVLIFRLLLFVFMVSYGLFHLIRSRVGLNIRHIDSLVLYWLVCAISISYSEDWFVSLYKVLEFSLLFLFGALIRDECSSRNMAVNEFILLLQGILKVVLIFALSGIILYPAKAYIGYGIVDGYSKNQSAWSIFPMINPNTLGQVGALIFGMGFIGIVFRNKSANNMFNCVIGASSLILAYSRTSMVGIVVFILIFIGIRKNILYRIYVFFIIAGCFVFSDILLQFFSRGQDIEEIRSLTGRLDSWLVAKELVLNNPFLGRGYYAGFQNLSESFGTKFTTTDNSFIDILLGTGILGFLLIVKFLSSIIAKGIEYRRNVDKKQGWYILLFISVIMFRSFMGPGIVVLHLNILILYSLMITMRNGPII